MCINFAAFIPPSSSKKACDFAQWDGITWLTQQTDEEDQD